MKKTMWTICLMLLSAAALGQAAAPASTPEAAPNPDPGSVHTDHAVQEPLTTLKVSTRVVEISAVVKSKDGEPMGGMTRDDFVLRQDGKEEPIHYFSLGNELPLTLALLVDTSGSQRTFIGDESLASDIFFETMLGRKEDRAMLVQFGTNVVQLKGLTNSPDALHLALQGMSSHASTAAGTLLNDAVYLVASGPLAKEQGRKAIVLLSDGGDNGSRRTVAEAIEQAQRGNIQIYSVLYSMAGEASGMGLGAARPIGVDFGTATLQKLSESTGGRVFTVSRGLSLRDIFLRIGRDLRLQYELGYTPPPDIQPNSYHRLDLKTKDKRLIVQARKGFFAQP